MIISNLMVNNVTGSINFYQNIIGMDLLFYVDENHESHFKSKPESDNIIFAVMHWNNFQLMLQSKASLSKEITKFTAEETPSFTGTLYSEYAFYLR